MKFPPQFLEQLHASISLSEVIGKRIPVRRHGREFQALCPFHKEKTPSFTINDEKGFYHCFGCAAHGDSINFIKEFDGVSFAEAVERLAGEAGIAVPEMTREAQEHARHAATLYDVLEEASHWFEAQLKQSAGRNALQYLQQRGIRPDTMAMFRIGFAPNIRNGLKQALMQKGITEKQLVDTGLIITPDEGATYDRFRERIMFPIRDGAGRIIAFGGRYLPTQQAPEASIAKYINSPETELFKKSEVLYNLNIAKKAVHETGSLVIAEGYLDVIAMWQVGISHAVAPLGTAFTSHHIERCWRLSPEPVMCLDGDSAGNRAMMRAAEMIVPMLKPGCSLRFAVLPKGEDPDSLIKSRGKAALETCLLAARPLSDVLWDGAVAAIGRDTPEKQAALERTLIQLSESIADRTVSTHYRAFFRKKLWPERNEKKQSGAPVSRFMNTPAALQQNSPQQRLALLEQQLVKLVLICPDLLGHAGIEEEFARIELVELDIDRLRQAIVEHFMQEQALEFEALCLYLEQCGLAHISGKLLQNHIVQVPNQLILDKKNMEVALGAWKSVVEAITLVRMQNEYNALLSQEESSILDRIIDLKRQGDATHSLFDLAEQEAD